MKMMITMSTIIYVSLADGFITHSDSAADMEIVLYVFLVNHMHIKFWLLDCATFQLR